MGLSDKYMISKKCNCSTNIKLFAKRKGTSCCEAAIQTAPTPCCESHTLLTQLGNCFRPTCDVVALANEHFFLTFKNTCGDDVPLNAADVFFYHQAARFLNIHSFNGTSYEVSLVDTTREGAVIEEDDCVIVQALMDGVNGGGTGSARCVSGQFSAPAVDADETIYILNGSGIPIGATLTITYLGETGSYLVKSFLSASGSIYAYRVTNTGSGLTVGTLVDGGTVGSCSVPVEIITDVDVCDLSSSVVADSIVSCVNGSPRGLVSLGEDNVLVGDDDGGWTQKRFNNLDCCIYTIGCMKFSGPAVDAEDTVEIQDVGLDCFNDAWDYAQANNIDLHVNIQGIPFLILDWDPDTRNLTLRPEDDSYLNGYGEFLEFCDDGTAICLGSCCQNLQNQIIDLTTGTSTYLGTSDSDGADYHVEPAPGMTDYVDGMILRFRAHANSTGPSTFKLGTLAAIPFRNGTGSGLMQRFDIIDGQIVTGMFLGGSLINLGKQAAFGNGINFGGSYDWKADIEANSTINGGGTLSDVDSAINAFYRPDNSPFIFIDLEVIFRIQGAGGGSNEVSIPLPLVGISTGASHAVCLVENDTKRYHGSWRNNTTHLKVFKSDDAGTLEVAWVDTAGATNRINIQGFYRFY